MKKKLGDKSLNTTYDEHLQKGTMYKVECT